MAQVTVWIGSGTSASSQFVLDGRGSRVAAFVNSHVGNGYFLAFAPASGGPFSRLLYDTGATLVFCCAAGGNFRAARTSMWGRVETSSAMTATTSVTIAELSWTA